jgi:CheY-like chemotaxis protein
VAYQKYTQRLKARFEASNQCFGGEFQVVAAVSDGRQAMIEVLDLDPDLLITDLSMPIWMGYSSPTS